LEVRKGNDATRELGKFICEKRVISDMELVGKGKERLLVLWQ
jgi:hypothetical protein